MEHRFITKIGAMDSYIYYAEAYKTSALGIHSSLKVHDSVEIETLIYPMLFCIHHSIELYIKAILFVEPDIRDFSITDDNHTHNLNELFDNLKKLLNLDCRFDKNEINSVTSFISRIDQYSKDGEAYRYPNKRMLKMNFICNKQISSEEYKKEIETKSNKNSLPRLLIIYSPGNKEWELWKLHEEERPNKIDIKHAYSLQSELIKDKPKKEKLERLLRDNGYSIEKHFPVYCFTAPDDLINYYLHATKILHNWCFLAEELSDEYRKFDCTNKLSPYQIEVMASMFSGEPIGRGQKKSIKKQLENEFEVDLSSNDLSKAVNIIKESRKLSPHLGRIHDLAALTVIKANVLLKLLERHFDSYPTDTQALMECSDLITNLSDTEYGTWLKHFLDDIKRNFTAAEIIDFIVLSRLGKGREAGNMYNYFIEEEKQFSAKVGLDVHLDHTLGKSEFIENFIKGLSKVGVLCTLNNNC